MPFIFCMNLFKNSGFLLKKIDISIIRSKCAIYLIGYKFKKIYFSYLIKNIYLVTKI